MTRGIALGLLFLCGLSLAGCNPPPPNILDGTHSLRKMRETTGQSSSMQGAFLLIAGGISGESHQQTTVTLAWKSRNEYIISSVPIEKVRMQFFDIEVPNVCFIRNSNLWKWADELSPQENLDHGLDYIVIHIKEQDWPADIQLSMNQKEATDG